MTQSELAVDLLGAVPIGRGGDEEAGEAAVLLLRVGLGEDQRELGDAAHRDPHLVAGDGPAANRSSWRGFASWPGRSPRPARSGRSSRAPRRSRAAAAIPSSAPRSPSARSTRDQGGLHRDDRPRRGVDPAHLLDDQRVAQVVEAAAAVLLRDRGAEVAHLTEHRGELAVEAPGAVVLAHPRRDLLVAELSRALGDQPLLVCQLEVQTTLGRDLHLTREHGGERLAGLGGPLAGTARHLRAVERRDRLNLADGRGEERLLGALEVVEGKAPSSTSSSSTSRSRVIEARIPTSRDGVRRRPSPVTQKIVDVGASSTIPSGRTSRPHRRLAHRRTGTPACWPRRRGT